MVTTTRPGPCRKLAAMSPEAYPPGRGKPTAMAKASTSSVSPSSMCRGKILVVPAPVHEAGLLQAGDKAGIPGEAFFVVEPIVKTRT